MDSTSLLELHFIKEGIDQDIRIDGRRREEFRAFTMETDVIPQSNGSCRLRISSTDLVASVKAEIATFDPTLGEENYFSFFVEYSFPTNTDSATAFENKKKLEECSELMSLMNRLYCNSKVFDYSFLDIVPGIKHWKFSVDVILFKCDGNLIDVIALAIRAALATTTIPTINVIPGEHRTDFDFELPDEKEIYPFHLEQLPIYVTLTKVGQTHIVDACRREELCQEASLSIAFLPDGSISSVSKHGNQNRLPPSFLPGLFEAAQRVGHLLIKVSDQFLHEEIKNNDTDYKKVFFRG